MSAQNTPSTALKYPLAIQSVTSLNKSPTRLLMTVFTFTKNSNMTSKKKATYNPKCKALFGELKRAAKVTSKDIAERLDVSAQTINNMSGKLDSIKVSELALMAEVLKIDAGALLFKIIAVSKIDVDI